MSFNAGQGLVKLDTVGIKAETIGPKYNSVKFVKPEIYPYLPGIPVSKQKKTTTSEDTYETIEYGLPKGAVNTSNFYVAI